MTKSYVSYRNFNIDHSKFMGYGNETKPELIGYCAQGVCKLICAAARFAGNLETCGTGGHRKKLDRRETRNTFFLCSIFYYEICLRRHYISAGGKIRDLTTLGYGSFTLIKKDFVYPRRRHTALLDGLQQLLLLLFQNPQQSEIVQRSVLGPILPEAMVCYLENYGNF